MRKLALLIALFLSVAIPSSAQFVAITDTGVTDASGGVLVSGTECFTPVNNAGTPIPAEYPGGTITKTPKCSVITNGTMTAIQLVSSAVTQPVNLCYQRTIVDNNTGKYVIGVVDGYGCVQPTVATNMNTVQPSTPGVALHTTGPTGPQGPIGATGIQGPVGPIGTPADGIDVDSYTGSDIGAKMAAAQAAAGTGPNLFRITQAGTISTPITLAANQALLIDAPITQTATINVVSNDLVACQGSSTPINVTAAILAFTLSGNVSNSRITNCSVTFIAADLGTFVSNTGTPTLTNISIDNNTISGGNGWMVGNGTTVTHSSFVDNYMNDVTNGWQTGGQTSYINVSGNHCTDSIDCIADEASVDSATFPSLATIMATGNAYNVFSNNTCENVTACVFLSTGFNSVISGNTSFNAADTAFDFEGSAGINVTGNTCYATGVTEQCISQFATGYNNRVTANHVYLNGAEGGIFIHNASDNPIFSQNFIASDNDITCIGTSLPCHGIHLEATTGTILKNNSLIDSVFEYGSVEQPGIQIVDNYIAYTASGEVSVGLQLPAPLSGLPVIAEGNTIYTYAAQMSGSYCIADTSVDGNFVSLVYIVGNHCWSSNAGNGFPGGDMHLTNNGGNAGLPTVWTVENNDTFSNAFTFDGGNTNTGIARHSNCVFNGTCVSDSSSVANSQNGLTQVAVTNQNAGATAQAALHSLSNSNEMFVGSASTALGSGNYIDAHAGTPLNIYYQDLLVGQIGAPTAPSGACTTNGAWVFSQDGHATFCASGTWTTKI